MTYHGRFMAPSPAGRTIEAVAGTPDDIVARGDAITTLGGQMRSSAELLRAIESRASEQQGKAIDKLKERIGSSYETLFQAADLYEPVGPVIADYGHALAGQALKLESWIARATPYDGVGDVPILGDVLDVIF